MHEEYLILTDSCSDLPMELVEELKVSVIPLEFEIKGKTYQNFPDNSQLPVPDFYNMMRQKEVAKTSQVSPAAFMNKFKLMLEINKNILVLSFSSALSGTYNSACTAAQAVMEEVPGANIVVVDTLAASFGEGLVVYYACKNRDAGMSIEENAKWLEEHRLNIAHWFTVDDLGTLKRGGRLSASKAFLGTLMQFKPVLHVDDLGRLVPVENARGRKKALAIIKEKFAQSVIEPENQVIFISHGDDYETAKALGDALKEEFKVKEIVYSYIGPVIGAHSGPSTIALFFYATQR